MSAAKDINWRGQTNKSTIPETSFLEYCNSLPILTNERIEQFVQKCHSDGNETALATVLFPTQERRRTNIRDAVFLSSWYDVKYRHISFSELVEVGKIMSLTLTSSEIKEIFTTTLLRLKSSCRTALKRGRITGSIFKKCCVANVNDPCLATIRRVIHLSKMFGDVPNIRDKKKIIQTYVGLLERIHKTFAFKECGLIINEDLPYFAASPDGIISCECHGHGCMKSTYLNIMESDVSLDAMTQQPNKIFNKNGARYSLDKDHEFYYNAQLQINISGADYCDLLIWSRKRIISVRVIADENFWICAMEKALLFHEQVLKPELLAKFFTNKKGLY